MLKNLLKNCKINIYLKLLNLNNVFLKRLISKNLQKK